MKRLGFVIVVIVLLIAVMPVSDNLPAQAAALSQPQEAPVLPPPQEPPTAFDWHTQGKVTSVKNQGGCGSCYAFASIANIESKILMRTSAPPLMSCTCGDICVNTTGWWRDGGTFNASATPIQSAVNSATSGDTICVKDGNYHENVDVNTANLTIQSENGTANCVVNASNPDDHVFNVTADWVNITGFMVGNATEAYNAGIYLSTAAHCNVSNNNVMNNYRGIYLYYSSNNTLTSNSASNNSDGIYLWYSSNNTFTNNTATNNYHCGIYLYYSSNNTLTNNTASNNDYHGVWLDESSNNTLTNNTASDNNYDGILLYFSSNNTFTSNSASNNSDGIYLHSSNNNTIYNNYFNNTNNAYDDGTNAWNTTKTPGINIIGGHYLGGNYWSGYSGNDTNKDGIGDTPYNITGGENKDYLPLTTPAFIDVIRNLPDTVRRGETFNVTVTFTAPEDKFNTISLTDLCPDGWNVTVDATWCTPNAGAVLATGNKVEIGWFGEPGVGFDNGTSFSALYKVTVSDYTPLGIHTFDGSLEYWVGPEGPYYENMIGDSEIEVIGATLEGHVNFAIPLDPAPCGTWIQSFVVKGFAPGIPPNATNALWTRIATTDEYGVFTVPSLDADTYDIGIKNCTCLSELETGVVLTEGNLTQVTFAPIREGDCDENDMATAADRGLLYDGWNSPNIYQEGHLCDLNRDGAITAADRGLLYDNWNAGGAAFGGF